MQATAFSDYPRAFFAGDDLVSSALGGNVSPELALTLTYVHAAVDTISSDFGTSTCQMFEKVGHDGRRRVEYSDAGIGMLARQLRWQPNNFQTSKAFWSTLAWQYLLRPACYAELLYRPGSTSFLEGIVPRHPDRVQQEVLPRGIRFKITEPGGGHRYITQDEMFVVRNTSSDGLNALSRTQYGSQALNSALTLQTFTTNYFKKGITASLVASYKGGAMEDEAEIALHKSITRYMSGADNAGGVLLIPDDIDIKALGVDAEKAQLLGLKSYSGRDIARMFKMPPSWLGIEGASAYASYVQDSENYKNRCQLPLCVEFEQAIQRDLIIADRFFVKFNLDYLTRGNLLERMQAYEIGIRSRVLRPSEARVREDMSPDEDLDRLSEGDFRPGTAAGQQPKEQKPKNGSAMASLRGMLAVHDNAVRVLRRERAAVAKLAAKYANDAEGWQAGLKDFYADHAGFVAQTMRVPIETARAYSATHGSQFETQGMSLIDGDAAGHWEREEAEDLAALALADGQAAA
jgi:HK97 family phage portal protein